MKEDPRVQAPNLDSVTTIREDGSRRFIFPSDVWGRYTTARGWAALGLIIIYILLPWVKVGDYPAVFLDVANRRFHLLGATLSAQDLWLLFFLITGLGFGLFLITALLGRLWCGWACPHSVFLDQVYRRIERWVDGDAQARKALETAPMSGSKAVKRIVKHASYVLVSTFIAHFFLSYFVSLPALWGMMKEAPTHNWPLFVFILVFTGALYFNFAWFREQLCIVICPYGRLQSVLIDDNSLVIGYDSKRGEPRGKLGTSGAGDCVACNRCVQVCPTGIDIRQGLQLECISCTACIDACDTVMEKVKKPKGLIRYDSVAGLAGGKTRWLRPRIIFYTLVLTVGTLVAGITFSRVKPANLAVTRIIGAPYIIDDQGVRNQFMLRIVNKRSEPASFQVSLDGADKVSQAGLTELVTVPGMAEEVHPLILSQKRADYRGIFKFKIILRDAAGTFELKRDAQFLGPDADLLRAQFSGKDKAP